MRSRRPRCNYRKLYPRDLTHVLTKRVGSLEGLGAARIRKMEVIRAKRATRREFIVETTMISRGIVNLAFSARPEFSVATRGQQYERKASDIISLQQQIAGDIADKLRSKLSGAEKQQVAKQ